MREAIGKYYRYCNIYRSKRVSSKQRKKMTRENDGLDMKNYAPRSVACVRCTRRSSRFEETGVSYWLGCSPRSRSPSFSARSFSRSGARVRLLTIENRGIESSTPKTGDKGGRGRTEIEARDRKRRPNSDPSIRNPSRFNELRYRGASRRSKENAGRRN